MGYHLLIPVIIFIIVILLWLVAKRLTNTPYGKTTLTVALIFKFLNLVNPGGKQSVKKMRSAADFNSKISQGKRKKMHDIHEITIPVSDTSIKARIYIPVDKKNLPVIVFYHGGGWVVCGLHTHDALCRYLAYKTGFAVISVDYRLAPEYKYPTAVNDSFATLEWIAYNGKSLEMDTSKISVCGDSAGGNMAAVMCLKARKNGFPFVSCQALLYPAVDIAHTDTCSYRNFSKGYGLTMADMDNFRELYLNNPEERNNDDVSPLLAGDHTDLPPAVIITAGFDVLRDDGELYAAKLKKAGVKVKLIRYEKMFHGFMCTGGLIKDAWRASDEVAEFIVKYSR